MRICKHPVLGYLEMGVHLGFQRNQTSTHRLQSPPAYMLCCATLGCICQTMGHLRASKHHPIPRKTNSQDHRNLRHKLLHGHIPPNSKQRIFPAKLIEHASWTTLQYTQLKTNSGKEMAKWRSMQTLSVHMNFIDRYIWVFAHLSHLQVLQLCCMLK